MTDSEIIAVVSAHKEGKNIQSRLKDDYPVLGWLNLPIGETIYWNFIKTEYRVAPEPRKPRDFWLCNGRDRSVWLIVDKYHNPHSCGGEMIHVAEVLE